MQRLMANVHGHLVADTPKDTGYAAVNWIPSTGAPVTELAGTRADAEEGRLNGEPQARGRAAIRAYELAQGDLYDTNNVDYLRLLNLGSSDQAPALFVQRAIVQGIEDTRL